MTCRAISFEARAADKIFLVFIRAPGKGIDSRKHRRRETFVLQTVKRLACIFLRHVMEVCDDLLLVTRHGRGDAAAVIDIRPASLVGLTRMGFDGNLGGVVEMK